MIWVHGMHGLALVPPQIDSANHGFFVARIAHTGSIDSSKVVVTDPDGASKVADFYPLGMHASAAIAAELTGAPVGRVLIDFVVLFSSVVFPLGMFALARLLAPQRVLLAGLTAFLTPFLALWAYPAMQLGLLALMVGMAMVPVSAVVVAQSLGVGSVLKGLDGFRVLVPSALVVVAVTAVHPSEVPTLMLLVTALLVGHFWRRWRAVVNVLGRGLTLMFIVLLLLLPTLSGLASGGSERSSFNQFATSKPLSLGGAITRTVQLTSTATTSEDVTRAGDHLPPAEHTQVIYSAFRGARRRDLFATTAGPICRRLDRHRSRSQSLHIRRPES